jgi:HAMP domain-containing protein
MGLDALIIIGIVLGAAALAAAIAVLVLTRRTQRMLRALSPEAVVDARRDERREFANLLRRYSEILGVEVVTGRIPNRGDTSEALRGRVELALRGLNEPGAVELLDEVGAARDDLLGLEPRRRAALNGLIAMETEWSIERWVARPLAWLADTREQDRLTRIAQTTPREFGLAVAS